jgi:uncharacterized membrane protein
MMSLILGVVAMILDSMIVTSIHQDRHYSIILFGMMSLILGVVAMILTIGIAIPLHLGAGYYLGVCDT